MGDRPLIKPPASRYDSGIRLRASLALVFCLLLLIALAGCLGCTRQAEIPVALSSSNEGVCGSRDDGLTHVGPPSVRSAEYYWAQSRAAISGDGRYVIFQHGSPENGLEQLFRRVYDQGPLEIKIR